MPDERVTELEFLLSYDILTQLTGAMERTGCSAADLIEKALRQFLCAREEGNAVYLSAPINALVEGLYVENTTISHVKQHGDFGLGTFNYLDGEMLLLDGKVYQIRSDGNVYDVADDERSPFACVTFFSPDTFDDIDGASSLPDLNTLLDSLIPSKNMLYAIRIDGAFSYVRCRAVPRSENYKPLVEATKDQPVFEFHDVRGSLAGFYTPGFMESLNAPGFHLHFITEDRRRGGHVMECTAKGSRIGIQHVPRLEVGLPVTLDYLTVDLTRDIGKDLEKAEK
ncbi:MAG: acetolactate decarboxylase [Syntrophorhabdaceae bacterium]|nr:acetolactate decarboxylase [Syntrophorhabdaceae bacterium]